MTLLLKQIFAFINLLNSDKGTNQIACGITAGFVLGMTPFFSLQSILIFLMILFFRIQIAAALITSFFFAFVAWILDPLFHKVGILILSHESLQTIFTTMYNMPLIPFTRFNNSIVMGAGIVSFMLAPIVFIISKILIQKYRVHIVERIKQTKVFKMIQATSLYKWYYKYDSLYGD